MNFNIKLLMGMKMVATFVICLFALSMWLARGNKEIIMRNTRIIILVTFMRVHYICMQFFMRAWDSVMKSFHRTICSRNTVAD